MLLLFEDMHWIDPTSLELLTRIVEQAGGIRLLLLATARPEFEAPWPNLRHVVNVTLNRLDRTEGQALVTGVSHGKALPSQVLDQIMMHADGVPLFIEELTKTVLESELLRETTNRYELIGSLPPLAIPTTLHASLLARLVRLATGKSVAQIGATIGRVFSYELIAAVSALPEKDLKGALDQLIDAKLVFQRGAPPDANYQFKHALVQDAAHGTLLREPRRALHARITSILESHFAEIAENHPELLAHHCTEAGLIEKAATLWGKAGQRSLERSALFEAAQQLGRALAQIALLSAT